jgi:hypothetical protein
MNLEDRISPLPYASRNTEPSRICCGTKLLLVFCNAGVCASLAVHPMKIDIDLKSGFLQSLKREVLATLTPQERALIEVSTGEMGNKPDAVKLGWLKMRTKETWTKQRYTRGLHQVIKKLRTELEAQASRDK